MGGGLVGWHEESFRIVATLDAHAGERERLHDKLWQEFRQEVERLASDKKYTDAGLEIYAGGY